MIIGKSKGYQTREYVRDQIENHNFLEGACFPHIDELFGRLENDFPLFRFEFLLDIEMLL